MIPTVRCGAVAVLLGLGAAVQAAHPLLTEDTATQGARAVELELGNAWLREGDSRAYEFGPQLSYGLLPNLDVILRPTWVALRGTDSNGAATNNRGAGDIAIDVKWRLYEANTLSLGTRAGIGVPSGDAELSAGGGKPSYHALLAASIDAARLAFHANLGYARIGRNPMNRRDLFYASTASVVTVHDGWQVLLYDVAIATNPDRAQSTAPAVIRVGAIYTVRKGFDIDAGYQARLNHAAPAAGLLAGLTLRW